MDFTCIHIPITVCVLSLKFFPWSLLLPYVCMPYVPWSLRGEEGRRGNLILPHGWSLVQDRNVFSLPLLDWVCCPFGGCFVTAEAEELQETSCLRQIQGILWCTSDKLVMRCVPSGILLSTLGNTAYNFRFLFVALNSRVPMLKTACYLAKASFKQQNKITTTTTKHH